MDNPFGDAWDEFEEAPAEPDRGRSARGGPEVDLERSTTTTSAPCLVHGPAAPFPSVPGADELAEAVAAVEDAAAELQDGWQSADDLETYARAVEAFEALDGGSSPCVLREAPPPYPPSGTGRGSSR